MFGEQPSTSKWNILGTNDASFNDGTGLPNGVVLQTVSSMTTAVSTGTTVIPADDTIPQITEGDQYMTLAITPKATTSRLVIEATVLMSHTGTNANLIVCLFQDAVSNALAAIGTLQPLATGFMTIPIRHEMAAGTTSSTTFRIRAGSSSAGTTTFNGASAGRFFGAITKSSLKITEVKA